jgi:integrase
MRMASLHKQPGRPFWFCAFTNSDGKRVFRSTKAKNKKDAEQICSAWYRAARLAKGQKLTPERAREVIAAGVADIFAAANNETLPTGTVRGWCKAWLETKTLETAPSTHDRYARIFERFYTYLAGKADRDIATLRTADVVGFRDSEATILSPATSNLSVKVVRMALGAALNAGLLTSNPGSGVKSLRTRGEGKRRDFTIEEIKRVLIACRDDLEWKGLILFGLYTGQRLGDLAKLNWRAIKLEQGEVAFATRKTGRRVNLPLVGPLGDYLGSLPANDDPNAFVFPKAAKATKTGTLSNRFREILVDAGLAEARSHTVEDEDRKGRDSARVTSELSFHSLRHSAVTFLKAAGVSDALAREVVGHESAAVNRGYTHLSTDDLRRAMDKMADVTVKAKS